MEGRYWRRDFWRSAFAQYNILDDESDLRNAVGYYAFCLRHGDKVRPWYVGRTTNHDGFGNEIFTQRKLEYYKKVVSGHNGAANILLFPLVNNQKECSFSYAYAGASKNIQRLERILIGMAYAKNPSLMNNHHTAMFRNVWVNGILGDQWHGHPEGGAQYAKRAFFRE
jgi:hypothetical protein